MGWDVSRGTLEYAKKVYAEVIKQTNPESIVFTDSFGVATPHAVFMLLENEKLQEIFQSNFMCIMNLVWLWCCYGSSIRRG